MNQKHQNSESHPGSRHWRTQRISSLLLIPLTLWLLWAIASLAGANFTAARAFLAQPFHSVMTVLFAAVMFYHAQMGIQVVCEDYISPPGFQAALVWITRIACLGAFILTLYAVYQVALGA